MAKKLPEHWCRIPWLTSHFPPPPVSKQACFESFIMAKAMMTFASFELGPGHYYPG
jgi:hypothetical protein